MCHGRFYPHRSPDRHSNLAFGSAATANSNSSSYGHSNSDPHPDSGSHLDSDSYPDSARQRLWWCVV